MKRYKAKKTGWIHYIMVIFALFLSVIFLLDAQTFSENPWIFIPFISPISLLIWVYLDTYYQVEGTKLKYHSGFLKGEIEINSIKKITSGKTLWVGLKPALAEKGLIITYDGYREIYLAPQKNEELIEDLIKINADIQVIGRKGPFK